MSRAYSHVERIHRELVRLGSRSRPVLLGRCFCIDWMVHRRWWTWCRAFPSGAIHCRCRAECRGQRVTPAWGWCMPFTLWRGEQLLGKLHEGAASRDERSSRNRLPSNLTAILIPSPESPELGGDVWQTHWPTSDLGVQRIQVEPYSVPQGSSGELTLCRQSTRRRPHPSSS